MRRSLLPAALLALAPAPAVAKESFLLIPDAKVAEASPAYRYANLTNEQAYAELDKRKIPYAKVAEAAGVKAPIRLTGALHGVSIHGAGKPEQRATNVNEICDARLALALDDFAKILERHGFDEVVHYTMYRPNVAAAAPQHEHGPDAKQEEKAAEEASRKAAKPEPADAKKKADKKDAKKDAKAEPKKDEPRLPRWLGKSEKGPKKIAPGPARLLEKAPPPGPKAPPPAKEAPKAPDAKAAKEPDAKAAKAADAKADGKPRRVDARAQRPAEPKSPAAEAKAPAAAPKPPPKEEPKRAPNPAPPGTRHPAGLAIDVGLLHKKNGPWISVESHFRGRIGDHTCGDAAKAPDTPEARELRSLVCEALDLKIFTYVLTPNYDQPHQDHFHMEIKGSVKWFLYH